MSSFAQHIVQSFGNIKDMIEYRIVLNKQGVQDPHEYYTKLRNIHNHLKTVNEDQLVELAGSGRIFTIDVGTQLRIIYCMEPKLKLEHGKKKTFFGITDQGSVFEKYIVVLKEKGTDNNIKNTLEEFTSKLEVPAESVSIFELKELLCNISQHVYVSKHVKIPAFKEDKIQKIVKKLQIKSRAQMPVILRTDPMARYIDARPGDIVKVYRYSQSSGLHKVYRNVQ